MPILLQDPLTTNLHDAVESIYRSALPSNEFRIKGYTADGEHLQLSEDYFQQLRLSQPGSRVAAGNPGMTPYLFLLLKMRVPEGTVPSEPPLLRIFSLTPPELARLTLAEWLKNTFPNWTCHLSESDRETRMSSLATSPPYVIACVLSLL